MEHSQILGKRFALQHDGRQIVPTIFELFKGRLRPSFFISPLPSACLPGRDSIISAAMNACVIANGKSIRVELPCSLESFLASQKLRHVVVEHNGEAVSPSEFAQRQLQADDRLEIVKVVAGG